MRPHPDVVWRLPLIVALSWTLCASALSEDDTAAFVKAAEAKDTAKLHQLVKACRSSADRAAVELLDTYLQKDVQGQAESARHHLSLARVLAEAYETVFGSRLWSDRVRLFSGWTREQKKEALRADELFMAARELSKQERPQVVIRKFEEARKLYVGLGDKKSEADCLQGIATAKARLGQHAEALRDYQAAVAIHKRIGNEWDRGTDLMNVANTYESLGKYGMATRWYGQALAIARKINSRKLEGNILGNLGLVYERMGDVATAMSHHRKAMELHREVGDELAESDNLANIGSIHFRQGRRREAIEATERSVDLRRKAGHKVKLESVLWNLGVIYATVGRYKDALRVFSEALPLAIALGMSDDYTGQILSNIGRLHSRFGRPAVALEYLARGADRLRRSRATRWLAVALAEKGAACTALRRYGDAISSYREAFGLYQQIGRTVPSLQASAGKVLRELANAYLCVGDSGRATRYLERAAVVLDRFGSDGDKALVQESLGHLYSGEPRAKKHYEAALALYEKAGRRGGIANALGNLGSLHVDAGDHEAAHQCYRRALELHREVGARREESLALMDLGIVSRTRGRLGEAEKQMRQALAIQRELRDDAILWLVSYNLALVLEAKRDLAGALENCSAAIDAVEKLRTGERTPEHRTAVLARHTNVYEKAISLLCQLHKREPTAGHAGRAFELAQRKMARTLLDLLNAARTSESRAPAALRATKDALSQQLSQAQSRLRSAEGEAVAKVLAEVRALRQELDDANEQIALQARPFDDVYDSQPLTLAQVQNLLAQAGPGAAVLLYSLGDDRSCLWAITKASAKLYELPPRPQLKSAAEALRKEMRPQQQRRAASKAVAQSKRLYDLLLKPCESQLRGVRELLIVPDGVLAYVPFDALATRTDTGPRYVIEDYTVRYAVSLSVMSALDRRQKRRQARASEDRRLDLLAFGSPHYGDRLSSAPQREPEWQLSGAGTEERLLRTRFPKLAFSGQEVGYLADLFGRNAVRVLTAKEATEEAVKNDARLDRYKRIHFAAHGFANDRRPERSALILAVDDDRREDGFLEAREIADLALNADLVVMSACQSALGKLVEGEGVLGLSRAFLCAGADAVVASLWNVNDRSTCFMMQRFYENMVTRKMSKARALRQAKLDLLRGKLDPSRSAASRDVAGIGPAMKPSKRPSASAAKLIGYTHPYYWATFILVGD